MAAESAVTTLGHFFLKWMTHLSFVIWEVEALGRRPAKAFCFESVSVVTDSITDNARVRTGNELGPKYNWKMNMWYGLPWHWNVVCSLGFHIKAALGSLACWHWPRAKFDCWRLHYWEITQWDYRKLISSQIHIPSSLVAVEGGGADENIFVSASDFDG